MDILKARKRAMEGAKSGGKADVVAVSAPLLEQPKEQPRKEAPQKKAAPALEQPPKSKKEPAEKKAKPATAEKKKEEQKSAKKTKKAETKQAEPVKHTPLDQIPNGALSPEEMVLDPTEYQELPGTMEMPELPDISDEELSGVVELGSASQSLMDRGMGIPDRQPEQERLAREKDINLRPPVVEKVEEEPIEEEPLILPPKPRKEPERAAAKEKAEEPPPPQATTEEEKTGDATPKPEEEFWAEEAGAAKISAEEMPIEFLSFMLGKEEYGIPLQRISEIIKPRQITEVPRVPQFVLGILTLRGVVIPVFDLAMKLALGKITPGKFSRIMIVYRNEDKIGLLVDRVRDVVRVLPKDIEPPPPVIAGVDMQFLDGVGRAEESEFKRVAAQAGQGNEMDKADKKRRRLLILLNLERVASL